MLFNNKKRFLGISFLNMHLFQFVIVIRLLIYF